jgi:HpiC1 cyclase
MRVRIFSVAVFVICFALLGGSAWADSIPVQNNSFEQTAPFTYGGPGYAYNLGPIPEWTISGTAASWEPGALMSVPDGSIMALINGTLSQNLGVALLPDENYTLSAFVGNFAAAFPGSWSISLDAGNTVMCTNGGATNNIAVGSFVQETCGFTTGASVPSGDLTILLSDSGITPSGYLTYAAYDDVAVSTPEPTSAVLLGIGLFLIALVGGFFKRKQTLQSVA